MTRVDFYVLKDQDLSAMHRFACRLALKALRSGKPVHVHTSSAADSAAFDELLWEYPEQRFVPHEMLNAEAAPTAPITIGHDAPARTDAFLINLDTRIPDFFARFDRVAEIIVDSTKKSGRDRYKHYRDRGYPLHHHDLDDWEA